MASSHLKDLINTQNLHDLNQAHIIFKQDDISALQALLATGYDINKSAICAQDPKNPKEFKGPYQVSLLSYAIEENALQCLQELVSQGIELNRSDTFEAVGGSALMYALHNHSANASKDSKDRIRNYESIIKILLQVPADTSVSNMYQETIVDYFQAVRDPAMKQLVLQNILSQDKTPEQWYLVLCYLVQTMVRYRQTDLLQQTVDNFNGVDNLKQLSLILDLHSQGFSQETADSFNQQVIQKIKVLEDKAILTHAITPHDFEEKLNSSFEKEKRVFKV